VNRRIVFAAGVSAAAALLARAFFRAGYPGVIFDAFHYYALSSIVSLEGLWNFSSRIRTYGYPLFVAAATGFSDPPPEVARQIVAVAQVALLLAASFYAARVAERVFRASAFFSGTYALMALNPITLIRATELLSDSLSSVLVGLSLFVSLGEGKARRRAVLAFLAAGASAAVRPVNLVILPALALLWILRARLYGERRELSRSLALGALCVALVLLPQLHGNVKAWDAWTPLLIERLYGSQAAWGTAILKYATVVVPGREPELVYPNPMRPEGVWSPGQFLREKPLGYLKTLGAHGFALVDHDFPFSYVTGPPPPWRWPLALANYAFLFLSVFGLAVLLRDRTTRASPAGLYAAGAALYALALVAVYLPVAVESRFSLPLYVILPPAAVHAVLWISRKRSGTILAIAIAGGGFIAACVQLSRWLSKLASISGLEFPP
jgi:hypothetical protein